MGTCEAPYMPNMDRTKMAERFDFLVEALNKIQIRESATLSFNEIYFLVYEIVRQRESFKLYNLVENVIKNHLSTRVNPRIKGDLEQSELISLVKAWEEHETCLKCFRKILFFLDRDITHRITMQNIQNMGIDIFKIEVFEPNKNILQNILLKTVQAERNGQIAPSATMKHLVDMILTMSDINHYEKYVEEPFLNDSRTYYKLRLQNHIESDDTIGYIDWYQRYCLDEKSRVQRYLHENTEPKILNILSDIFTTNVETLPKLEESLHNIFNTNDKNTGYDIYLETLYKWFSKCQGISTFRQYISNIFREKGLSISDGKKYSDQSAIVEDLLNLRQRFFNYETRIFNDLELRQIMQSDFTLILNNNSKMPEYLAYYVHNNLKKENIQNDLDLQINTFIDLYKCLVDKDVFESFYKICMSKRLLNIKPSSIEMENKIISRLKGECAYFTNVLEEMINDIKISETHKQMFNDYVQTKEVPLPFEFTLTVLKQGLWKISSCTPCHLPASFSSVFEVFYEFYNNHHSGRKLTIMNNLGHAIITGNFKTPKQQQPTKYTFTVSTLQVQILLLFNDRESLTFREIQELIGIDYERLKFSIIPISLRKACHRILEKVGNNNKSIKPEDVFRINCNYNSKTKRVKVPFQATKIEERTADAEDIWRKTEAERTVLIDSRIVRAMKTRRVMTHVALVEEVITLLKDRFKPDVKSINSRILVLIDKEYIEKKPNENSYVYLP